MIAEPVKGHSLIHRIDPRVKILTVFLFSVVVACSNRLEVLTTALCLSSSFVLLSRVPFRQVGRGLIPANIFILVLWCFLPFTFEGEVLLSAGPLAVTRDGVMQAARISIKCNVIMMVLISLVSSTSLLALGQAMHELKVPEKIVHLLFFAQRYIHVIHREYMRLVKAMKVRGFRPGTNVHTYKAYAYLVGMLLVRSSDRAERVRNAMLCRGFSGRFYSLSRFSLKTIDIVSLIVMLSLTFALGVFEWKGLA